MARAKAEKRLFWTEEALTVLRSQYRITPTRELAAELGCTPSALYQAASLQGISRTQGKRIRPDQNGYPIGYTRKNSYYGVLEKKVATTGNKHTDWKRIEVIEWEERFGPVPDGFHLHCPSDKPRSCDNLVLRRNKTDEANNCGYPVGHIRRNYNGLAEQKISSSGNPGTDWKRLDVIEWERTNGPIPDGWILQVKSGMPRTAGNMRLVRRTVSAEEVTLVDLRKQFARRLIELEKINRATLSLNKDDFSKRKNRFSPEDDEAIKQLYLQHTTGRIAEILGRSFSSVQNRMAKLRAAGAIVAKTKKSAPYTFCEDALINELLPTHTHAQIAGRLGRSTRSVEKRIYRLRGKR
jgi:hypothetical protein